MRSVLAGVLVLLVIAVLTGLLNGGQKGENPTTEAVQGSVQTLFAQTAVAQVMANNNAVEVNVTANAPQVQVNVTANAPVVQVNFPTEVPLQLAGVYQYGLNILELYTDGTFRWPTIWDDDSEEGRYRLVGDVMYFDYYDGNQSQHRILTMTNEVMYFEDGYQFRRIGPPRR